MDLPAACAVYQVDSVLGLEIVRGGFAANASEQDNLAKPEHQSNFLIAKQAA